MPKINNTVAYEISSPIDGSDIVIGSALGVGGDTKNFQMSDIAAYVMGANTLTLQDVCDNGTATTTGMTIADTLTLSKPTGMGLSVTSNASVGGTLGVSQAATFALGVTIDNAGLAVNGSGGIIVGSTSGISSFGPISGTALNSTGGLLVSGTSILGEIDSAGPADIADTLTLSKPSGTALSVSAGAVYFASNLDVFGLHHQWGALTVEGITTLNNVLDANSTADISDTLTLSKATGNGLDVTSSVIIGGQLTAGTSVVGQTAVTADGFQTNSSSFTATSSAVQTSFGTTFTTFDATIVSCKITGSAPASATATGTTGTIVTDATHIYVCTATDTWKRVAIATW